MEKGKGINMQVNNRYQPSFKAVSYTPNALKAMSKRMPAGKFLKVQSDFIEKYKDSAFDISVCTTSDESIRLAAKIKKVTQNGDKPSFYEYIEETIFSSTFRSPEKFIEKLAEYVNKKETVLLGK